MKFNPFRPGSIVNPGMFAGRYDEIVAIEKHLFQAKHGNSQNFLIIGERGIGKSSLMMYAEHVARGNITIPSGDRFNFLVLSVELKEGLTSLELLKLIGNKFKSELNLRNDLKTKAAATWDFLKSWEILGVKYNSKNEDIEPTLLIDELAQKLKEVIDRAEKELDGVAIFIDEADKATDETKLGETLKLLTEKITRLGSDQVIVGLAGLPELSTKLKKSHASSTRIFQIFDLKPLEEEECKEVVINGLNDANEKNKVETMATDEALHLISNLSEGYPHFIQQFAFSAFEEDRDNSIDEKDVESGAFRENGALDQLGHKYFQEHFYENIGTDDYRKVLEAMANYDDAWVVRAQLLKDLKADLKETQVDNALKSLKSKNIIIQDHANRGVYKLPTKSFATWIKIKKKAE